MSRAFPIPYTFTMLNWAAVVGLYHFVRRTAATKVWIAHPISWQGPQGQEGRVE